MGLSIVAMLGSVSLNIARVASVKGPNLRENSSAPSAKFTSDPPDPLITATFRPRAVLPPVRYCKQSTASVMSRTSIAPHCRNAARKIS